MKKMKLLLSVLLTALCLVVFTGCSYREFTFYWMDTINIIMSVLAVIFQVVCSVMFFKLMLKWLGL